MTSFDFCVRCFHGESNFSDATPPHQSLLKRGLLQERSLFKCSLLDRTWPRGESATKRLETSLEHNKNNPALRAAVGEAWEQLPISQVIGLSRVRVEVGDQLTVIRGCNVPIVLRSVEGTGHFRVIGAAYVECLMDGQAVGILPELAITLC